MGRAQTLAGKMIQGEVAQDMHMVSVKSSDIDDRVSWILYEIAEGKRDALIRKLAGEILTGNSKNGQWAVKERDWEGEVSAFYHEVRRRVRYTRDIHQVELFQKPRRTLETRIGDCDDLTILLGSLLQSVGFPCLIRVIGINGSNDYSHVYIMAGVPPHDPKKYLALDASRPEGPGWEAPNISIRQDYEVVDPE